ncbi:MAG: DUF6250 domain-containing protein [Siphonobacter sp.]
MESCPNSSVYTQTGALILDTQAGVTVWFRHRLSDPIVIEYVRTIVVDQEKNDRLSDLNRFWMANEHLFAQNGSLASYDSLQLYYVGIGGNSNTTTRFRKYIGTGERRLSQGHEALSYFLQPNHPYRIRTIAQKGTVEVYVNGILFFS